MHTHLTAYEALDNVLKLYHDPTLTKIRSRRLDAALYELRTALSNGEFVAGPDECDTGVALTKAIDTHLKENPMQDLRVRRRATAIRAFHFQSLNMPQWLIDLKPTITFNEVGAPILEVGNTKADDGDWILEGDNKDIMVTHEEGFLEHFEIVQQ